MKFKRCWGILSNKKFLEKASSAVIESEKAKHDEAIEKLKKIKTKLKL